MTQQQILQQAAALHQKGDLAGAERLYRQALAAEPENFPARYYLAVAQYQQQRGAEALASADAALKINPDAIEALNLRGILLQAAGRPQEALASFTKAVTLRPDQAQIWFNRAIVLDGLERYEEALESYGKALALQPSYGDALYKRGMVLHRLNRLSEALVDYDAVLAAQPDNADVWSQRGLALQGLGRLDEALAAHDRALAIRSDHAGAWNNRGTCLQAMKRFEDAALCYEKFLALEPQSSRAGFNLGFTLWEMKRFDAALAAYDKALGKEPSYAPAWNHRGVVLRALKRTAEAMDSFQQALARDPDFDQALFNLASVLAEMGRVDEALGLYTDYAKRRYGLGPHAEKTADLPHKQKHDAEQRAYLAARGIVGDFHLEEGARLPGPAVTPANEADIAAAWQRGRPQIVVVDNLLTPRALESLQRFCWGSTIWRKAYQEGYLGAMPEHGFSCPLLAQIAEELQGTFPTIFRAHALRYLWGFKYDSSLAGIAIHADFAAVNVNFWITPDEANLDPQSGGLVVWDVAAPRDWDFDKYNRDVKAARQFLEQAGAKAVTIPYRANRAVIFDSNLFHKSDAITFQEGYVNRRINVTMLYGDRQAGLPVTPA